LDALKRVGEFIMGIARCPPIALPWPNRELQTKGARTGQKKEAGQSYVERKIRSLASRRTRDETILIGSIGLGPYQLPKWCLSRAGFEPRDTETPGELLRGERAAREEGDSRPPPRPRGGHL